MPAVDRRLEERLGEVKALRERLAAYDSALRFATLPMMEEGDVDADALRDGGSGGTSGPVDPWQQSVEARLGSLDDRLGRIEPAIAGVRSDLAGLSATSATKDSVTAVQQDVAVIKATMATKDDLRGLKDDMYSLERAIGGRMQKYLAIAGAGIVLVNLLSTWAAKLVH